VINKYLLLFFTRSMSKADVSEAKKKIGVVYAAGCTGFVADILGEAQKHSS